MFLIKKNTLQDLKPRFHASRLHGSEEGEDDDVSFLFSFLFYFILFFLTWLHFLLYFFGNLWFLWKRSFLVILECSFYQLWFSGQPCFWVIKCTLKCMRFWVWSVFSAGELITGEGLKCEWVVHFCISFELVHLYSLLCCILFLVNYSHWWLDVKFWCDIWAKPWAGDFSG